MRKTSSAFLAAFVAATTLTAIPTAFAADTKVGELIDDASITTQIKASLIKDQALKAFDIHVDTDKSVVNLTGTVDTPIHKADAQRIAENVKGVAKVNNKLTVR